MVEWSYWAVLGAMLAVATVIATVVTAAVGIPLQGENLSRMIEDCNDDYGAGEWVAVPANASERGLYMGQMAVCVSEDSPRAEDCDRAWIFGCDPPERPDDIGGPL